MCERCEQLVDWLEEHEPFDGAHVTVLSGGDGCIMLVFDPDETEDFFAFSMDLGGAVGLRDLLQDAIASQRSLQN